MRRKLFWAAGAGIALITATPSFADHSWQNYHWPIGGADAPFDVLTALSRPHWAPLVSAAVDDWAGDDPDRGAYTDYLEPAIAGEANHTSAKKCDPATSPNTIVVCSDSYGRRGWLGVATIWIDGAHIQRATTKLNDSYHDSGTYGTTAWRSVVACQEIGHDFGLGHQNEDFSTDETESCMEYTQAPLGNETPDAHDYEQLEIIYNAHFDETGGDTGDDGGGPGGGNGPPDGRGPNRLDPFAFREVGQPHPSSSDIVSDDWGVAVAFDAAGRPNVFRQDLGGGLSKITHVTWVPGFRPQRHHFADPE